MEDGIAVKTAGWNPMVIVERLNHRLGPRPSMGDQGLLRAEHCRARFLLNAGEGGVGRSRHSSLHRHPQ